MNCVHTITNTSLLPKHISCSSLHLQNQNLFALFSTLNEPQTFEEAAFDPAWVDAMQKEYEALETNQT